MVNLRKHLSVILVLLLVFPMIYQTTHLFHDHGSQLKSSESQTTPNNVVELHDEFNDCLICDFDYVVFLTKDQFHTCSNQVYFLLDFPITKTEIPIQFDGFNNSLRAPPTSL